MIQQKKYQNNLLMVDQFRIYIPQFYTSLNLIRAIKLFSYKVKTTLNTICIDIHIQPPQIDIYN